MLLLDEPFGALDAKVRKDSPLAAPAAHEMHITVSSCSKHDQDEALLEVADRVVVMNEGRIQQVGTPQDVYDHPATRTVSLPVPRQRESLPPVEEGRARPRRDGVPRRTDPATAKSPAAIPSARPHDIAT